MHTHTHTHNVTYTLLTWLFRCGWKSNNWSCHGNDRMEYLHQICSSQRMHEQHLKGISTFHVRQKQVNPWNQTYYSISSKYSAQKELANSIHTMPSTLGVKQAVHGHHVYRTIWEPLVGKEFIVLQERWKLPQQVGNCCLPLRRGPWCYHGASTRRNWGRLTSQKVH